MPKVRKIEQGAEIDPDGRTLERGHATIVEGISGKDIEDAIGRVHRRIIRESERFSEFRCPLAKDCQLVVTVLGEDDEHPSGVVFECPNGDEKCDDVISSSATEVGRQVAQANSTALEGVMKLGP